MSSPDAPRTPWPRTVAFVVTALWMVWAPLWRQVLSLKWPLTIEWQMFSKLGQNVCSVRYARRAADGTEQPLDRFRVLGHADRRAAPGEVRRITSADDAKALGAALCKELERDADVRLYARCGARAGWDVAAAGEENLCARPRGDR